MSSIEHLARDAERARRMLDGVNDPRSIHDLERYAAELEGQLQAAAARASYPLHR